jgi:phage terminase large subunit-like protein
LFEWSAPDDASPDDVEALAMANPSFGRRGDPTVLIGDGRRAMAEGGEALAGFKTESMCIRVRTLDPAIDPGSWAKCADPGSLAGLRSRVAAVIDVAPDGGHVTLYAAGVLEDGRIRVDPIEAWDGIGCVDRAERALTAILLRARPKVLGWFPNGPAAALAAALKDRGNRGWPPPGIRVEEIKAEAPAVCMGFEKLVEAAQIAHSNDPLLDAHVAIAEKLHRRDMWVFGRKNDKHVDAVYAAAGAVHLAQTMPAPVGKPRIIRAKRQTVSE